MITKLHLKVIPNGTACQVVGWLGDRLKVKVNVPADKGKANLALRRFLADTLTIPIEQVTIISGLQSAYKIVQIQDLNHNEVIAKLLP